MFRRLLFWLKAAFHRDRFEAGMDEEMRLHIELQTENFIHSGVPAEEARRRALAAFGGIEAAKDHCRDARGVSLFQDALKDLRYAVRMLAKSPAFTLTAVLSLAIGIGANAAIFSLVDTVLLRMVPVREPQQLLEITRKDGGSLSYPMYEALRQRDTVFSGALALSSGRLSGDVQIGGVPLNNDVHFSPVSSTYFDVLGVTPIMGNGFTQPDDSSDGAVISYGFWQRSCGGDPLVIGKLLRFGGRIYTITGIAPPGFTGIAIGQPIDIWIPITWLPRQALQNPGAFMLRIMVRVKPGVTDEQARTDAALVAAQRSIEWKFDRPLQLEVAPAGGGLTQLRRRFSRPLLALTTIVGLLLLITIANIAGMLLARAQARQKEIGIRLSLGASRARLIRQLLTESAVLAFAGAAVGILLAPHIVTSLIRFLSSATGDLQLSFNLDRHMLAFTGLTVVAAVFLFGLAPALAATRFNLSPMFKGAARVATSGHSTAGLKTLMVAQVAISCVLLVGTVLFARSLLMLTHVDLGFRQENVLLLHAEVAGRPQPQTQPFAQVLDRLSRVPGVISTALTSESLFSGNTWTEVVSTPAFSPKKGQDRESVLLVVSPGFFRTMGTAILQGRDFDLPDTANSPRIAIVNEAMARYYFGRTDVVGRTFRINHSDFPEELTIVGMVRNTKYKNIREDAARIVYLPYLQFAAEPLGDAYIAVRTTQTPMNMDDLVRKEAQAENPRIEFHGVTTQAQLVNGTIAQDRMLAQLSGFFGFAAAALVFLGLYGITSYEAGRRTAEIGVRIALGANSGDVVRLVMGRSVILVASGIAAGLAMAIPLTRLIESLLYGVRPRDTLTLVAVIATLFLVTALAAYWPARHASTLDPTKLLKSE